MVPPGVPKSVLTQNVTHCAAHTASRKAWLQSGARVLRDPERASQFDLKETDKG